MYGREVRNQGKESLKDSKLNVDALIHAVTHCRYDEGYSGLGDSFESDEALEGPKRDSHHLGVLGRATHEYGAEEVIRLRAIWGTGECEKRRNKAPHTERGTLHKQEPDLPDANVVVACSGDERRMARDFSAALARYGELFTGGWTSRSEVAIGKHSPLARQDASSGSRSRETGKQKRVGLHVWCQ